MHPVSDILERKPMVISNGTDMKDATLRANCNGPELLDCYSSRIDC
jgi:hypothetical protein